MPVLVRIIGLVTTILASALGAASEARVAVDANLITAVEASSLIGRFEAAVEREGQARAPVPPQFPEAVRTRREGRIGVAVLAWSTHGHTTTLVPWYAIAIADDAKRVSQYPLSIDLIEESQGLDLTIPADHFEARSRLHRTDTTLAIPSASALLCAVSYESRRSVIDIVGHAPSYSGLEPADAWGAALKAGQIVNGLSVGNGPAADVVYYHAHVIGGPDSFVMQVASRQAMREAFLAKFRLDVAGLSGVITSDERFLTADAIDDPDP